MKKVTRDDDFIFIYRDIKAIPLGGVPRMVSRGSHDLLPLAFCGITSNLARGTI